MINHTFPMPTVLACPHASALNRPFIESLVAAHSLSFAVAETDAPLTDATLADVRLVCVFNVTVPFTSDEHAAVHAHVRRGGSLLVIVDEDLRNPRTREIHDPLLAPHGLRFTDDIPYLHNVGAIAEPGPIVRARYELPYSGGRAVTGGTPLSHILDTDRLVHAAHVELPSGGRVIAMAEAMAGLGHGKPEGVRLTGVPRDPSRTTYWGKDARPFMEDVFAWLLRRENE